MATRAEVVAEARTWLGTRWHHQARLKGVGVDCMNVVVDVAEKLRLLGDLKWEDFPQYHAYPRTPDPKVLMEGISRFMDPIEFKQAKPGDVLVFQFTGEPQHFGIITTQDPMYFLHAFAQARKVVENRLDTAWKDRIVQAFRFASIED